MFIQFKKCVDPTVYNSTQWCGLLFSATSVFSSCIAVIISINYFKFNKNVYIFNKLKEIESS